VERKDVKRIRATNQLAQKVGSGEVEDSRVEAAQKIIEVNQVDFVEIAAPFMDQLGKAVKAVKKSGPDADTLNAIIFPIMNLKANAATFNYPVVSDIAGTVMNFLDAVGKIDGEILVIAENLHKAITVVIAQKMSGKDHPGGAALVQEFKDVCKRYMEKHV
jgi:hypothetical protein